MKHIKWFGFMCVVYAMFVVALGGWYGWTNAAPLMFLAPGAMLAAWLDNGHDRQ